jgi:hypothetical protein
MKLNDKSLNWKMTEDIDDRIKLRPQKIRHEINNEIN